MKCLFPLLCLCFHVSHKTCWSTKAFDTLTQYHKSLWELLFGICDSMLSHFCVPYVLFLSSCLSERPTFLRRPINQVVLEEEAVEFRCQVQGDRQPTVRWKKDEIDIPRGRWDGDTLAETSANLKHYFKRLLGTAIKAVCDVGVELRAEAPFSENTPAPSWGPLQII